jgi:flagellar basal-body rod protein FlgB
LSIKFDQTFESLETALNKSTARQKAIAHNVSNIDTPGFKRFLVDFEEQLKNPQEMEQQLPLQVTEPKHISASVEESVQIQRDLSPALRKDGNNVDLEAEMINMIKNDTFYNAAINQMNKKISMLKLAIDGK